MDRVLGGIKNFCAAGKLFLEYSRYTLLKKTPSQNRREKCAAGKKNFTEPCFLKKLSLNKKLLLQWRTN
jgi:hypothetical protein